MNKLSLALLLAATSGACVANDADQVNEPTPGTITSDLDKENGGFTMDDEASLFGDDALFADAELEATRDPADPMAADPAVRDMRRLPDARLRGVVMTWGQLRPDLTNLTPKEWSGRITASRQTSPS